MIIKLYYKKTDNFESYLVYLDWLDIVLNFYNKNNWNVGNGR